MPKHKKWEVKGLSAETSFSETTRLVISQRLDSLTSTIKKFLKNKTPANLHEVRISIRRLRYNMETFFPYFEKKKFLIFYKTVERLQDLTGSIRDLDVLMENLDSLAETENIVFDDAIRDKIQNKNSQLKDTLTLALMEFIHCKELKEFRKMI